MKNRYDEYKERLKDLGYNDMIIDTMCKLIDLAEENVTSPSRHGLTAEAQKIIEKNFKLSSKQIVQSKINEIKQNV